MCNKVILENGCMLRFIPDCYKNEKICDKDVDCYSYALKFVPDCYKTQAMCDKAVDTCLFCILLCS